MLHAGYILGGVVVGDKLQDNDAFDGNCGFFGARGAVLLGGSEICNLGGIWRH